MTPRPSATPQPITAADLTAARDLWRKHALRRYWGLIDATKAASAK